LGPGIAPILPCQHCLALATATTPCQRASPCFAPCPCNCLPCNLPQPAFTCALALPQHLYPAPLPCHFPAWVGLTPLAPGSPAFLLPHLAYPTPAPTPPLATPLAPPHLGAPYLAHGWWWDDLAPLARLAPCRAALPPCPLPTYLMPLLVWTVVDAVGAGGLYLPPCPKRLPLPLPSPCHLTPPVGRSVPCLACPCPHLPPRLPPPPSNALRLLWARCWCWWIARTALPPRALAPAPLPCPCWINLACPSPTLPRTTCLAATLL